MIPEVSGPELARLDFYRASELHGGLILGQIARRSRDPKLIRNLTAHAAEELGHAQIWAATIHAVGGTPQMVRNTYQARYAEHVGAPVTTLEVLALTHVFERRVHRHFCLHVKRPGVHRQVRRALRRMIYDERDHLLWVRRWLRSQDQAEAERLIARYTAADEVVYAGLVEEFGFAEAAWA